MPSVEGYAALFGAKAVVLAVLGELAGGETSSVLAGSNVRPGAIALFRLQAECDRLHGRSHD
jgi:hypothetical protein